MLWAAWADALGFISELTTEENLRRRTGGRDLSQPMAWSRIIGGRMGVRVDLPKGCYSDDTQLRLATSRAINSRGFDVEAFSRVEMTVWPSYALGGGRASRLAATAMAKQQANWANNVFNGWENAGGNGAAMRIQPHVYAARQLHDLQYIDDVICNTIVTHGHPRGIVGAVFHAITLAFTLEGGKVPAPNEFGALLEATHQSFDAFRRQSELALYWVPQWQRVTERSFEAAWHETVMEVARVLETASPAFERMRAGAHDRFLAQQGYEELVQALNLDDPQVRGSGTLTAAAALLLASAFPENPAQSSQIAASRLHTDTDTIGTMAAAIVGAAAPRSLWSSVLDQEYLITEATRLHAVSQGQQTEAFPYPDLLLWQPPKSALEATGTHGGQLTLAGLGALEIAADPVVNKDSAWVWARTSFGQSVLVKHRRELRELPHGNRPLLTANTLKNNADNLPASTEPTIVTRRPMPHQPSLFNDANLEHPNASADSLLSWLERRGYGEADLGLAIRTLALSSSSEELHRFVGVLRGRLQQHQAPDRRTPP